MIEDLNALSDFILNDAIFDEKMEKTSASVSKMKKKKEAEAVERWRMNKNQQDFDFLWRSLQPLINKQIDKYSLGSPVPKSAFRGEAMKLFVKALETYNSARGAAFPTHLTTTLQRLYRFNLAHQNVGRITSEAVAGKITTYQNRKAFLEDKLGRPPTALELSDDLSWGIKDIERMERDLRPDIPISPSNWFADTTLAPTRFKDKFNSLYMFESNPTEKLVLEYLYGLGGKPKLKTNKEIARMVGVSANRISQIKDKFAKKLKR